MLRSLTLLLLTLLLTAGVGAGTVSASEETVRLGIEALDSEQSYFDLSLEPGQSAELTVRFSNHGETPTDTTIFPADVHTITGGGMGMADLDDEQTGATTWLSFETETLELPPGEAVDRTFTVTVPGDAEPGDYISSIVIQNSDPQEIGSGEADFSQTVRQGVAVAINVPGERTPSMEIGEIEHTISGDRSVVLIEVENTGNTHLRPTGEFTLLDDAGEPLASSAPWLDTVYAGTSAELEVLFESQLPSGEYGVSLALQDEESGAEASVESQPLTVADPDATTEDESDDDAPAAVAPPEATESNGSSWGLWLAGGMATVGLLILLATVIVVQSSRTSRPFTPAPSQSIVPVTAPYRPSPPPAAPAPPRRQTGGRPIRQLVPPGRRG